MDSKEGQNREKWEQRKSSPPAKERKSKSNYYKTWCFVPDDYGCGCGFCTSVCLPYLPKVKVVSCEKVELWVENKHQEKEFRLSVSHIRQQNKVTGED